MQGTLRSLFLILGLKFIVMVAQKGNGQMHKPMHRPMCSVMSIVYDTVHG